MVKQVPAGHGRPHFELRWVMARDARADGAIASLVETAGGRKGAERAQSRRKSLLPA